MEIYKITSPSEWKFFAKGNANILFEYTGSNDYLKHRLLRARLEKDDKQYISTCELYDFIELKCKPLFPLQIIDIQLVVLNSDFIMALSSEHGKLMQKERYGLLIPNMVCGCHSKYNISKNFLLYIGHNMSKETSETETKKPEINSVIFEIKPKWLYENKTRYCRTCLFNQLRGFPRHFCPLDLLYPETIDRGIDDIFQQIPEHLLRQLIVDSKIPIRELFKHFLMRSDNVFRQLKDLQKVDESDRIEHLTCEADVLQNLSLVMTLRDVGLLLKFEKYDKTNDIHNSQNNVGNLITVENHGKFLSTCNIYDLDLKSSLKYQHWIDVENKLQDIYNSSNPQWRYCINFDSNR